jgi:hypothetical protein
MSVTISIFYARPGRRRDAGGAKMFAEFVGSDAVIARFSPIQRDARQ